MPLPECKGRETPADRGFDFRFTVKSVLFLRPGNNSASEAQSRPRCITKSPAPCCRFPSILFAGRFTWITYGSSQGREEGKVGAKNLPERLDRESLIKQCCQGVRLGECDAASSQPRFEELFCALLGVIANGIKTRITTTSQFALHDAKVALCLFDPLCHEEPVLHRQPRLSR
jgi:hypothetical protein